MKMGARKPFTLLLCLCLITFMLYGPYFIKEPTIENIIDKAFVKEENWKGIITIWDYPHIDSRTGYKYSWMYKKIKNFERKYPGVFIEFKSMSKKDGMIRLDTAIKANDYPDIAPVGAVPMFQNKKALTPLNNYLDNDELKDYKDAAINSVTHRGDIYGLPYMMDMNCMLLNVDYFNTKGVDLPKDGIWSYKEFVDKLKKLTYDENGDGKLDHFGFNSYIEPDCYYLWGILLSDGASIIEKGEFALSGDKAISGLQKIVDLKYTHKVTPPGFGEMSGLKAWNTFAVQKNVAVYPSTVSNANVIKALSRNGKGFNYSLALYPIGESGLPISFGNPVTAYGVLKQEDKAKEEMCVKFIKYLCSDEDQKQLVHYGVFPVKKSAGDIYKNDRAMHNIEKNISMNQNTINVRDWRMIEDIIQSQIRMAVLGKKTSEQAINDGYTKVLELEGVDRSGKLRR